MCLVVRLAQNDICQNARHPDSGAEFIGCSKPPRKPIHTETTRRYDYPGRSVRPEARERNERANADADRATFYSTH